MCCAAAAITHRACRAPGATVLAGDDRTRVPSVGFVHGRGTIEQWGQFASGIFWSNDVRGIEFLVVVAGRVVGGASPTSFAARV